MNSVCVARPRSVSIGTLLPPECSLLVDGDESGDVHWERLFVLAESLRDMFHEAADDAGIRIRYTEHQLFSGIPMGKNRRRALAADDLVIALDPSPTQASLAMSLQNNPLRRSVIVATKQETLEKYFPLAASQQLKMMQGETQQALTRVFPMHVPLNEDEASNLWQRNLAVARSALTFPHNDLKPTKNTPGLVHAPECLSEHNANFLREMDEE